MLQTIRVFDTELNLEQDKTPQTDCDIDLSDICIIPELALTCGVAMHGTLWPSSVTLALYFEFCERQENKATALSFTEHSVTSTPHGTTILDRFDIMSSSWWQRRSPALRSADFGASIAFDGMRVLELGAGTGICGLVCRRFTRAAFVTITDIAAALPLIERNRLRLDVADTDSLAITELFWGQFGERFAHEHVDVLMASDVIYETKSHEPLLATWLHFWKLNPALVIILAHRRRYEHEDAFFGAVAKAGFKKRDILTSVLNAKQRSHYDVDGEYYLYQIWRDHEPADDEQKPIGE